MDWDFRLQRSSDYIQPIEFIDKNNQPFVFSGIDILQLKLSDMEGKQTYSCQLNHIDSKVDVRFASDILDDFTGLIKYSLTLDSGDSKIILLSGYVFLEE